jgi:hypothetical protein
MLIRVDLIGNKLGGVLEMGSSSVASTGVAGIGSGSAMGAAGTVGAVGVGGTVGVAVCLLTCGINNSSPPS